jgi:hypothetical protein
MKTLSVDIWKLKRKAFYIADDRDGRGSLLKQYRPDQSLPYETEYHVDMGILENEYPLMEY